MCSFLEWLLQTCCTMFNSDGCWYRAKVIGLPMADTAEVEYVDYGNKCVVPRTALRKLR